MFLVENNNNSSNNTFNVTNAVNNAALDCPNTR